MTRTAQSLGLVAFALFLLSFSGGCGRIPVYPVRGKITFEGQPMKGGGSISFMPMNDQPGKAAGGEISSDGSYVLMTHRPGDGSMTGQFRVVIAQVTENEPERSPDGSAPKKSQSLPKEDRIPTIYADPQNSPLTATVEAKDNELNFDLKRQ